MKQVIDFEDFYVKQVTTDLFVIVQEDDGPYQVEWLPHIKDAMVSSDLFNSGVDLVRLNVQTSLNALLNSESYIDQIGPIVARSVNRDLQINNIAFNCFIMLGI